ncbi:hypothetical protein GCM10009579_01790 [Streptomyces javensis]|uniref:Uncharacterized protein n=1 Tax=Streptomyces javensis TaxID=114698 RepID=A0ABN1WEM4_9ACTN
MLPLAAYDEESQMSVSCLDLPLMPKHVEGTHAKLTRSLPVEFARWCQERRVRRPVRISLTKISGCSKAAKCPPLSASP